MAKTAKKKATRGSAQKIWLAGLGALAMAEEEGGKFFRNLVNKGEKYEKGLNKPVERATRKVKGTVHDLESALDKQVTAALHRVGVPTRKEIADLTRKVDRLSKSIAAKNAKKKTAKKKTTRRVAKRA